MAVTVSQGLKAPLATPDLLGPVALMVRRAHRVAKDHKATMADLVHLALLAGLAPLAKQAE